MSNIIDSIQVSGVTYTIQGSGGGGNPTVELTQAEYNALVESGAVQTNTYYIITDAQAGDLTQYWTSAQTSSAITAAVSGKASQSDLETVSGQVANKQDTLVSGTNIKTINNESILGSGNIDIQGGGGKAIEAGRGIAITTGATADTVSFNLPISAGTSTGSLIIGENGDSSYSSSATDVGAIVFPSRKYYGKNKAQGESSFAHGNGCTCSAPCTHAEGFNTTAYGFNSHSEGQSTIAYGYNSHAEGEGCSAMTDISHAEGYYTVTNNSSEHASGKFNISNTGSTDADKTLFSVGNGTADNARHNAFEIRRNGDIYIQSGNTDIKLQDHLGGGGGSSYTAGDGIDITNDVISVTGKQDTLSAGTGISIVDNVISATGGGGGKAIEAGRGIAITSGETADTVSFNLPISADTDGSVNKLLVGSGNTSSYTNKNIVIGDDNNIFGQNSSRVYTGATIIGYNNSIGLFGMQNDSNSWSTAIGRRNKVNGGNSYIIGVDNNFYDSSAWKKNYSYVIGRGNTSSLSSDGNNLFVFGAYNTITKSDEFALGKYNTSSSDGTTSGNTFFSIGNGTADNARHNAFEIRQNGDIYCSDGTNDVKLQDTITATSANTTALGGLKLVKLSQSEYDNLATKDNSTLYVIVN